MSGNPNGKQHAPPETRSMILQAEVRLDEPIQPVIDKMMKEFARHGIEDVYIWSELIRSGKDTGIVQMSDNPKSLPCTMPIQNDEQS